MRGRLKVDARRAALKLRDHGLAEPASWLVELVRAAALAEPARIDVTYDADDLFVRFDGAPWPSDVLDHAVTEGAEDVEGRRLRRFASACIAALGHDAGAVTVFTRDASSQTVMASRVTARQLETTGVRPAVASTPKDGLPVAATCVHVERATSFAVLGRALGMGGPPADVDRLARAVSSGAPIAIQGVVVIPKARTSLVSVRLATPIEATLELTSSPTSRPSIRFDELGLHFCDVWPGELVASHPIGQMYLPVFVHAQAEALPTNVSRSRVGDELVAQIAAAARRAIPALVEAARREVVAARARGDEPRVASLYASLLACAMVAMASGIREVGCLFELPLLYDACGRLRCVAELARVRSEGRIAYVSETGLGPEVAPMTRDVFFASSPQERALFNLFGARPFEEVRALVERGRARRLGMLAAGAAGLEVPFDPATVVSRTLARSDGITGKVTVLSPCRGAESLVRLYVDGHVLETLRWPWSPGTLLIDAAIASEGCLTPTFAYEGARRDSGFERAISVVWEEARAALHERLEGPDHGGPLIRAVVAGVAAGANEAGRRLSDLPLWASLFGVRLSSHTVLASARTHHGLRYVLRGQLDPSQKIIPGAQPVLLLDPDELPALRLLVGPDAALVDYSRWVYQPRTSEEALGAAVAAQRGPATSPIYFGVDGTIPFAVGASSRPVILRMHRGSVVEVLEAPHGTACTIAVDEDYLWPGVHGLREGAPRVPEVALQGNRRWFDRFLEDPEFARLVVECPLARRVVLSQLDGRSLLDGMRARPLFTLQQGNQRRLASLRELSKVFKGRPIATATQSAAFADDPVVIVDELAEQALGRVFRWRSKADDIRARLTTQAKEKKGRLHAPDTRAKAPPPPVCAPPSPAPLPTPAPRALETTTRAVDLPPFSAPPAASHPPPVPPRVVVAAPAPTLLAGLLGIYLRAVRSTPGLARRLTRALGCAPISQAIEVVVADSGRPLRFDRKRQKLTVNTEHESIRAVVGAGDDTSLIAAALSEINREDDTFNDAEEVRALFALLADLAASPP